MLQYAIGVLILLLNNFFRNVYKYIIYYIIMNLSKQLIIIFEGHDGSGKSNIAAELSKKLQIPMYKRHAEKNRWFDTNIDLIYGVDSLVDYFEDTKQSVIIDRFYPSEYAYAKTFKRPLCENKLMEIDKRMSKLNTIIIHCFKSPKNQTEDEHDIIKKSQYKSIIKNYREFLSFTHCNFFQINTNNENLPQQIEKISKAIYKMVNKK